MIFCPFYRKGKHCYFNSTITSSTETIPTSLQEPASTSSGFASNSSSLSSTTVELFRLQVICLQFLCLSQPLVEMLVMLLVCRRRHHHHHHHHLYFLIHQVHHLQKRKIKLEQNQPRRRGFPGFS